MISTLSGLVFVISLIGFIILLILGLIKTRKVNKKTWIWLLVAVASMFIGAATTKTPEETTNKTKEETRSATSSSSSSSSSNSSSSSSSSASSSSSVASSVPNVDENLLNTFNSDLSSGDTNKFINAYLKLDIKEQSAYYQKFRKNTDIKIKGTAFYKNSAGSRLYLYVNEDEKPLVALDREQSYDGLTEQGQLHNVFILKADRGTFSNVPLMTTVVASGSLGATNIYQKDKFDMPFDLNDAKIIQ